MPRVSTREGGGGGTNKCIQYSSLLGCGHCKRLAPAYEEVGQAFSSSEDVVIAKVDADAQKALGSRFGVRGYPTLKFFPKGSTEPEE